MQLSAANIKIKISPAYGDIRLGKFHPKSSHGPVLLFLYRIIDVDCPLRWQWVSIKHAVWRLSVFASGPAHREFFFLLSMGHRNQRFALRQCSCTILPYRPSRLETNIHQLHYHDNSPLRWIEALSDRHVLRYIGLQLAASQLLRTIAWYRWPTKKFDSTNL